VEHARPESTGDPEPHVDEQGQVMPTQVPAQTGWTGVKGLLLVGGITLVGALLAGWLSSHTSSYAASALVEAAPVVLGGVDQSESASTYVRTELLYTTIYSSDMHDAAVAATSDPNVAPVTIALRSGTTIMFFNAVGATAEQAAAIAASSSEYYVDEWRARTLRTLERSVAIIDDQLGDLPAKSSSEDRLNDERVDLQTQIAAVKSAERIVGAASAEGATRSVSILGGAILGGLVGLVVGLSVLLLLRRRRQAPPAPADDLVAD
jgi:hypothetical protein